jgi:hypothetical protein
MMRDIEREDIIVLRRPTLVAVAALAGSSSSA